MVEYSGFPSMQGRLAVHARFVNDWQLLVGIFGDPDGLRSLAKLLVHLADFEQETEGVPAGERAHWELYRRNPLAEGSAELVVWRADASVTGKLPDFMED